MPDQSRHLNFLWRETLSRHHEFAPSLENMAMASFTRLRPSRIPARKNSVRRCCLTVRGLMLSCPAMSLLLHPWTRRFRTCWSRGVTLTSLRSIMLFPSGLRGFSNSRMQCKVLHELRQLFALRNVGANPLCSLHFGPCTRVFMWLSEILW